MEQQKGGRNRADASRDRGQRGGDFHDGRFVGVARQASLGENVGADVDHHGPGREVLGRQ